MSDVASWIRHGVEMRRPLLVKDSLSQSKKIVIVGGGLSGMCNAFRIAQKSPDVEVILIEFRKNRKRNERDPPSWNSSSLVLQPLG